MDTTNLAIRGKPPIARKKRLGLSQQPLPREPADIPIATIMVVEPDVLARMAIADYLRTCGYKVIEADTVEDAFTILQSDATVDVVFAEISALGASEGFALAKQIRERYPSVDVILTSNIAQAANKAGELCEHGVLKKPYHPEELIRRIHVLREHRRSSKLT